MTDSLQECPGIMTRHDASSVHLDGLLQLWPRHLEAQLWQSQSAIKCVSAATAYLTCRA
jgi:hypothetical protein